MVNKLDFPQASLGQNSLKTNMPLNNKMARGQMSAYL
jgi:hypothetical protein